HTSSKRDWSSDVCSSDLDKGRNINHRLTFRRRALNVDEHAGLCVTMEHCSHSGLDPRTTASPMRGQHESDLSFILIYLKTDPVSMSDWVNAPMAMYLFGPVRRRVTWFLRQVLRNMPVSCGRCRNASAPRESPERRYIHWDR